MRIGLLNNLRAGRNDAQVGRLLRYIKRHPEVAHVETQSAAAVPEALSELFDSDIDVLVVNGGDGTLQHALTEMLGSDEFRYRIPMIAPLRGGRTNMTAGDLGTHRDSVRGLANLINAAKSGELERRVVERQVLRVEYGHRRDYLYGMFFGVGMIYRAIEMAHRLFDDSGKKGAIVGPTLVTANLVARAAFLNERSGVLTPDKVQVLLDSDPIPDGEFSLMIASGLQRLFSGMRPFWGTGPAGVRFTAIRTGAQHLVRAAPGILSGRPGSVVREGNGYTSRNVKCAELRMDTGFTVDGELVAGEPGRTVSVTANDTVRFVRA